MNGSRMNIIAQPKLLNPAQPLKIGMLYDIEYQFMRNGNETMNGIVEYLALIHF
jgi:hypothetical protein